MKSPPCEFRDPDGSYVLVRPLDDRRCRVLASNVAEKGDILWNGGKWDWTEASEDLGGYTRLGPCELEKLDDEDANDPGRDLDALAILTEKDVARSFPFGRDPEEELVDPKSLPSDEPETDRVEPYTTLLGLALHHQRFHEHRAGKSCWLSLCDCPGVGLRDPRARARLHALLSIALHARRVPDLPRVLTALRQIERGREGVA